MENDLTAVNISPVQMIQELLKGGISPDNLEKYLEIQERFSATQAKKAYNADMVLVQQEIPIVAKTLKNTTTGSKSARLENVIIETKPIYTKYGFCLIFYEGDSTKPDHMRTFVDVIHKLGHKETYHLDLPLDKKGLKGNDNKTDVHAKGSSSAYSRRYLMCMVLNIPTGDDNDGNGAESTIDANKVKILNDLVAELKYDLAAFLTYMEVEKIEDIPASKFGKGKIALEARRGKK